MRGRPWRNTDGRMIPMLVEITAESHGVVLDIAYAGADNFTGRRIYARPAAFLVPEAAAALVRASDLAAAQGCGLLVYDAFRPLEAQWALWNHTPDPDYVSDPRRGGIHTRGVAVDLTLTRDGRPLDMGTGFDDMRTLSHHGVTEVPPRAQGNRSLLLGIMSAAGWDFYMNEWWHYQLFRPRRYAAMTDREAGTRLMKGMGR